MTIVDLVIVGCGPVGAVVGNLAGRRGLSATILDRFPDVFTLPRAIHFDAHIMRILQEAGLAETILPETRVWERSTFTGADGLPIQVHEWPTEKTYGWDAHYLFYQPTLERVLRSGLERYDRIDTRLGVEATSVVVHTDHVVVTTRDMQSGETTEVAGRYLVAADGASSLVRSSSGIELIDGDFDEPWLVVDVFCDQQLGQLNESEMLCDPERPSTRVPGPGNHHRWEFMLLPGESPEDVNSPEMIRKLLAPWVSADEVEIVRASVYRFHSLIADRWRQGRAFLVGDAAHQTPPFLGQGMCHGMRDAQNLTWKLAAVLGGADERLLDSYEVERRPHVTQIIDMAVAAGREICVLDPVVAAKRDIRTREAVVTGDVPRTTFQGMPALADGVLAQTPSAGELFPQPMVSVEGGTPVLFDDAVAYEIVVVAAQVEIPRLAAVTKKLGVPTVGFGDPETPGGAAVVALPDLLDRWSAESGATVAILRPDRYVYGTASDSHEALRLLDELWSQVHPGSAETQPDDIEGSTR